MNLITLRNLNFKADDLSLISSKLNRQVILNDISLDIKRGKIYGILGESGSGKTTLAKIISGIYSPTGGKIEIDQSILRKGKKANPIQLLFQNSEELINPSIQINANIRKNEKYRIEFQRILLELNLDESLLYKKGYHLSGGERQKIGLALILASKPSIIIMDEPFSAVDTESKNDLIQILQKMNKEDSLTQIIISHDIRNLEVLTDEIIVLFGGRIVEQGQTRSIFRNPLHPYTKFLLDSTDFRLTNTDFLYNKIEFISECSYISRCKNIGNECEGKLKMNTNSTRTVFCNKIEF